MKLHISEVESTDVIRRKTLLDPAYICCGAIDLLQCYHLRPQTWFKYVFKNPLTYCLICYV
jgi:hypothetical protein